LGTGGVSPDATLPRAGTPVVGPVRAGTATAASLAAPEPRPAAPAPRTPVSDPAPVVPEPRPPVFGAPEREGSPREEGAAAVVHTPPPAALPATRPRRGGRAAG